MKVIVKVTGIANRRVRGRENGMYTGSRLKGVIPVCVARAARSYRSVSYDSIEKPFEALKRRQRRYRGDVGRDKLNGRKYEENCFRMVWSPWKGRGKGAA